MDKEKVTVKEANKVEAVQGKLTYEDKVIQKIIGISLEEVEGLLTVAEYGKDIHKIYNEMKEIITKEVKNMTGLEVIEVNVNVVDIKTEEQHEEDSVTLQDKMGDATEAVSNFTSEQADKAKELASKGSSKAKELTESRVK